MAGLMDIGKSGLQSYREALSVTGQNIANINTDGYKRREASLAEVTGSAGGINSLPSQVGLGVRVDEIRRSFDEFLLNKARNATSYAASANSYVEAISQLEDIILPGDANIGAAIGRFMETLQEVAANPSDIAPRIVALQSGETLADMFHQTAALIEELQNGVNTQSDQALTEINLLANSLANINRNIASSAGKAQNALLDNRDAIIDKISDYVEVTVTLESTGAATLQLGGSGNGPLLVKNEKAYTLASSPSSEDIEFFLAEGADLNRTSQVTNGRLRGLADAYKATSGALNSIHQLAYQLITDLNQVHNKGVDMEGQPGIDMFHGIAYDAVPSVSNLGNGAAVVMITDINQVSGEAIRFSYDGENNLWHAFDTNNKTLSSGRNQISLPGISIEFSGRPVTGDEMMLTPAIGAAHNIQFNLTRAEQIAAAEGFLVSVDIDNQSNAAIDVIASVTSPKESGLPNLQDIIANTHSTVTSSQFIRDGAIAVIPANTDHIDLISMLQQSTAQFGIANDAMSQISTVSLEIDDGVNAAKTYHFDLSAYAEAINLQRPETDKEPFTWYDAGQIAKLMNVGALTATSTDVDDQNQPITYTLKDIGGYANGADGIFSLALKENSFLSGSITFGNAPTSKAAITDRIDTASDIQIFTREGRHIAGNSYTGVENLISAENGFLAEAEYRDDYLNKIGAEAYMGIGLDIIDDIPAEILNVTETDNGYQLQFDRLFGIDTAEASPFGRRASAAQFDYRLSIDGLDVTLTETNVDGENGEALASAALTAIRANAPIPSMTGVSALVESVTVPALTDDQREQLDANNRLSLEHEGVNYLITENNGQYTVTGGRASSISLSFDSTTNVVSSDYVNLPQEGDSVTLRFEDEDYQISILNGEVVVSGGEAGRLSANITSDHKLYIVTNGGSLNKDAITILDDTVVAGNLAAARRFGLINTTSTAQTVFSNLDVTVAKTVTQDQAGNRTPDVNTHPELFSDMVMTTTQEGDVANNIAEIQELTGLSAINFPDLADNRLIINLDEVSMEMRFDEAPGSLNDLVSILNDETVGAGLEASFSINTDNDTIIVTMNDAGDIALGTTTVISDLPEIQTVSGFGGSDLARLENNRLEISDGTNSFSVSFTTPPANPTELADALNSAAQNNNFVASFTAGNDTITATWSHSENVNLISVNLIETYDAPSFDVKQDGDKLIVEKRDSYGDEPMTVTTDATSNAGQRITLTDLPDEELIIFLTGSDDGNGVRARNISASYDMLTADALLPKRDISITVTDATSGKVEFIDTATGSSIASRYLDDQGKADAIGYDITLTGVVADQDAFHITGNQDGIHDNRNLLDIIALQDGRADKGGFQKVFSGLIAEVGADIEANKLNAEAANALKDASLESEAMYSGVNLDTEASKLIELQQAYQASARILQTARELFDTLLQTI